MLTLTLLEQSSIPFEAETLNPDQLVGKSLGEIAAVPILHGNREIRLNDAFRIEGNASDARVDIIGDCSRIKSLGNGMKSGHLIIRGDAGMHLGAEMTGGEIHVHGAVGDWLGAEMRGGFIHVHGNAGNLVGATYRGGTKGMRGGTILINGDAGDEVAANMRRGLIAIGGRCGDLAGLSMIAGTLLARGGIGDHPGAGMKRGGIVVLNGPVKLPPTFRSNGLCDPVYLHLYFRQLAAWGFPLPPIKPGTSFQRFSGDLLALGKGEILVATEEPPKGGTPTKAV